MIRQPQTGSASNFINFEGPRNTKHDPHSDDGLFSLSAIVKVPQGILEPFRDLKWKAKKIFDLDIVPRDYLNPGLLCVPFGRRRFALGGTVGEQVSCLWFSVHGTYSPRPRPRRTLCRCGCPFQWAQPDRTFHPRPNARTLSSCRWHPMEWNETDRW